MRHKYANTSIIGNLANGVALGIPAGLAISGTLLLARHLSKNRRERKLMKTLEKAIAADMRKDRVGLSSDMFTDLYPLEKRSSYDWKNVPASIAFGGGALVSGIGIARLLDYLYERTQRDRGPESMKRAVTGDKDLPKFILDYRDRSRREYDEAVKMLRAVTDDSVMKSMKTASFVPIPTKPPEFSTKGSDSSTSSSPEPEAPADTKSTPKSKEGWTGAIGMASGLGASALIAAGLYALHRGIGAGIRGFRDYRDERYRKDVPYAAWVASNQDRLKDDLRAYIDIDDERDAETMAELKAIAEAYNRKYNPEPEIDEESEDKKKQRDSDK